MRDNGIANIVIGLREGGPSWKLAESDGWVPGKTLLPIEAAAEKGTVIMYLLSDAGQKHSWDIIKERLDPGNTLYFSHGFAVTYAVSVMPPTSSPLVLHMPPPHNGPSPVVRLLDGFCPCSRPPLVLAPFPIASLAIIFQLNAVVRTCTATNHLLLCSAQLQPQSSRLAQTSNTLLPILS